MRRFCYLVTLLAAPVAYADTAPPNCGIYTYQAQILRVVDGDTVEADIDLGFDIWIKSEHLRLHRVEAPENNTDAGKRTTEALRNRIEGKTLYVCTHKMTRKNREAKGSFGRYLIDIYDEGENVNDWLLETGLAVPFEK